VEHWGGQGGAVSSYYLTTKQMRNHFHKKHRIRHAVESPAFGGQRVLPGA